MALSETVTIDCLAVACNLRCWPPFNKSLCRRSPACCHDSWNTCGPLHGRSFATRRM